MYTAFDEKCDVIASFAVPNSYHRYKSYKVVVVSKFSSFCVSDFPPFCGLWRLCAFWAFHQDED